MSTKFAKTRFINKSLGWLVFFFVFVSLFIFVKTSFAQNAGGIDLTISPPVFDLTAKPGDHVKQTFRIRNNQSSAIELSIQARRLISDPQSGNPTPASDTNGEELSWVKFDPGSFTVQPQEWQNVTYTIDIPTTAAYGYYYVFRIAPKNQIEQKTSGAAVNGEVLVVVLLNVQKEGAISKADLVSFSTKQFITEYLPVNFSVTLSNPGNVHVKPRGNIFITRDGKKDLAILDVNAANGSILPSGKRTFESSWNEGFLVKQPVMEDGQPKLDKNGKVEETLTINWNKLTDFRIGPYTAHMLLVYDDGKRDQTIEGETKFWVLPYTFIGGVIVALIIIFLFIKVVIGSYIKGQIRKGQK